MERFNDRVEDYARWRPGYPPALVGELCGLASGATLADIGCGTGKLAEIFLDAGYRVLGVEPNAAMRQAAQTALGRREGFSLHEGRAEATGLPSASVDAILVGQAFHWFEPVATRAEFRRILRRPAGLVALIWNDRDDANCPVLAEYERLLQKLVPAYADVERRGRGARPVEEFFAPAPVTESEIPHAQSLTWEGVRGRVLSASYVPRSGPAHEALFAGLRQCFEQQAVNGLVELRYITRLYAGRLAG